MRQIPTDFANRRTQICGHPFSAIVTGAEGTQYCADCERDARAQPPRRRIDWLSVFPRLLLGFGVLCIVVIFGAGAVFAAGLIADKPSVEPPITVERARVTVPPPTNTPRPTATPEDTRTPYPSPTASVYVQKVNTSDNNLHTNQTTATPYPTYTPYPTLTHYPTSTPVAYTPTSTPNATATQAAFDQKIANSKAVRSEVGWWLALAGVTFALVVLVFAWSYIMLSDTLRRKLDEASAETHVEELDWTHYQPESPVAGVTISELRDIRLMLAQGKSPREIEETVYGYAGGSGDNSAYKKVLRAIGYLTPHPPHRPTG